MRQEHLASKIKEIALVALVAFCLLPLYLGYWSVVRAPELRASPYNKRAVARLELTRPGRLLSSDSEEILGRKQAKLGHWEREYPSPRTFCHLTGYAPTTCLQKSLQDALLGVGRFEEPWASLFEPERSGNDVQLTINANGQRAARQLLAGQKGAVVALNPKTGEVLVLASAPTYNPVEIATEPQVAELFRTDPDSPELNRALQGLYPPGSIFKLLSAAAALEGGKISRSQTYDCPGSITIEGHVLHCEREHGTLDLAHAIAKSCNVYFAHVGETLGIAELSTYAGATRLFQAPVVPLPAMASRVTSAKTDALAAAGMAIGQGDVQLTPFAAAELAAAIANGGALMRPTLVKAVFAPDGRVLEHRGPAVEAQVFRPTTAKFLASTMELVVAAGTGVAAQWSSVRIAGKTGSAENQTGAPHAWFIAFAPADDPRVAVAVVVEHGGAGAEAALPIARQVIEEILK
jgi:peptidoglycan glycosyltransferase